MFSSEGDFLISPENSWNHRVIMTMSRQEKSLGEKWVRRKYNGLKFKSKIGTMVEKRGELSKGVPGLRNINLHTPWYGGGGGSFQKNVI